MIAQHEQEGVRQVPHPTQTSVVDADDHLNHLLIEGTETPWYKSFIANVKDFVRPEKLPPLEVTSKPVAVKDIWGQSGNKKYAGATSLVVHAAGIALLVFLGTNETVQQTVRDSVQLIAPDLAPYQAQAPPKKEVMGGGGGGGDRSLTQASKGRLPRVAPKQFVPPTAVINNPNPKLVMEPTIVVQPDAPLPNVNMAQYGNPLGVLGPPSNGPGSGGGIGTGRGGGVGPGSGVGYGPGSGAGTGGGIFKIGGGVSRPELIFKKEPEYSEEARKAKFQGTVLLSIVVQPDGTTSNIRIVRPLGMGLDEKAIEAVKEWRFRPSLRDGKPVPVYANVEVNFRLL
jgi:TonB family protein